MFGGTFEVLSAVDNTHFTYKVGSDTRNGASSVALTTGVATWFNANHVKVSPVTGAWIYAICGRTSGSMGLLGFTLPQNSAISGDPAYLTFDDFGSPMTTPPGVPGYLTNVCAGGAATNDNLVTTIVSGAGTTSVTLANAATNSVSGAGFKFDNVPNIIAAQNAVSTSTASSSGTAIYFPVTANLLTKYTVNSVLQLPVGTRIVQSGPIALNDAVYITGSNGAWHGSTFNIPCQAAPSFTTLCLPSVGIYGPIGIYEASGER